MRFKLLLLLGIAFSGVIIFNSCKKEYSCENCLNRNQPPFARAGSNQIITLPTDSITLDGSASTDPDGSIITFRWTRISGPPSLNVINPDSPITKIKNLILGVYSFELKVTDNHGLSTKDTINVTVNAAGTVNQPPIARAGTDQTITLPINAVTINASGSSDPDGSIVLYSWKQLTGPNQSTISNASQVSSIVNNLIQGIYQFQLNVTDNGGLSAIDTVQITVNAVSICAANRPIVNARLVPFGTLSQARIGILTATAANKIIFAGGFSGAATYLSTRVDIYDFVANTWSTAELSIPRMGMTAASIGNKIYIAGGYDPDKAIDFTRVDIYDAVANTWSTAELSEARSYLTSATLGDKVFFAGGSRGNYNNMVVSDRVDIYNTATNTWSTALLSEARSGLSANTIGNKIYFAGGRDAGTYVSNRIDIYDAAINSWSTSGLSEGKMLFASITVENKIYWAGGINSLSGGTESLLVEIRDINTQVSTLTCLSEPRSEFDAVLKGNEIVFFTDGIQWNYGETPFDIYNVATDRWSIGKLNEYLTRAGIISVNNKIYVAGGVNGSYPSGISNQVRLLEW